MPALAPTDQKWCRRCDRTKPASEFYVLRSSSDGRHSWCAECLRQYDRDRQKGKYRNPEGILNSLLKRKYGITLEAYKVRLDLQEGVCAICGNPPRGIEHGPVHARLNVDHNHKTGQVRDLLCQRCNNMIGLADDDVDLLLEAIQYLRKWGENHSG